MAAPVNVPHDIDETENYRSHEVRNRNLLRAHKCIIALGEKNVFL
jgi:hypothetical protein